MFFAPVRFIARSNPVLKLSANAPGSTRFHLKCSHLREMVEKLSGSSRRAMTRSVSASFTRLFFYNLTSRGHLGGAANFVISAQGIRLKREFGRKGCAGIIRSQSSATIETG